jgi:hypothetical protein
MQLWQSSSVRLIPFCNESDAGDGSRRRTAARDKEQRYYQRHYCIIGQSTCRSFLGFEVKGYKYTHDLPHIKGTEDSSHSAKDSSKAAPDPTQLLALKWLRPSCHTQHTTRTGIPFVWRRKHELYHHSSH